MDEKKEQALLRLREEKKGYFTRLATELTQGSRKERASRQLRQQKVELRNTEEKRIQLNLSLRAVQRRESKVNGQWRISPSPGFILNRPICRDDIQHESKKRKWSPCSFKSRHSHQDRIMVTSVVYIVSRSGMPIDTGSHRD